jgi:hypothetical protein
MKSITASFLAILLAFTFAIRANAQSTESIWLTVNTTTYKTRETVVATLNASSATPIQGFTFQIRYDPACLKPINAVSQVPPGARHECPAIASALGHGRWFLCQHYTANH